MRETSAPELLPVSFIDWDFELCDSELVFLIARDSDVELAEVLFPRESAGELFDVCLVSWPLQMPAVVTNPRQTRPTAFWIFIGLKVPG